MTMYRVYARFIPTGKMRSTITSVAGVNALERSSLWDVRAVERIKINEEI